jgi:hypothetical protein
MPEFSSGGSIKFCAAAVLAAVGIGLSLAQPSVAQTRTIASLGDVPAYIPAPYHPHTVTSLYSAALYDSHPYYGGAYLGGGPHYWH